MPKKDARRDPRKAPQRRAPNSVIYGFRFSVLAVVVSIAVYYYLSGGENNVADTQKRARRAVIPKVPSGPNTIDILTPTSGEVVAEGTTKTITWVASDDISVVSYNIELYQGQRKLYDIATNLVNTTDMYDWSVPTNGSLDISAPLFSIRVWGLDADDGSLVANYTTGNFKIS
ncbi:hypothetical protein HK102_010381, partial [Quaeritorhiza haematococci]